MRYEVFTTTAAKRQRRTTSFRRRLYVGAALLLAIVVIMMPHVFAMTAGSSTPTTVEITVTAGETLWDIAARHKTPRSDTRRMIEQIRVLNELADATVYPGQVLHVPVHE